MNIRELARAAGVSPAAVSLALRGRPGVSESTRKHILEVAAENGYRPNPMVSALMSQVGAKLRSRVDSIVGLLTSFDLDTYPVHSTPHMFVEGMKEGAKTVGYVLESFTVHDKHRKLPLARMLHARSVRGLIFHLPTDVFESLDIDFDKFAMVSLGYPLVGKSIDFVCNDHGHSVRLAVSNLKRLGYRRIGLAMNGQRPEQAEYSMLGSMLALQYSEEGGHVQPLARANLSRQSLLEWVRAEKPDVVLSNDHLAYKWLQEAKVKVPDEVAFAHLDHDYRWKGIAGVDQDNREVGHTAMEVLASSINTNRFGLVSHPRTVKVRGTWVDGETAPAVRG